MASTRRQIRASVSVCQSTLSLFISSSDGGVPRSSRPKHSRVPDTHSNPHGASNNKSVHHNRDKQRRKRGATVLGESAEHGWGAEADKEGHVDKNAISGLSSKSVGREFQGRVSRTMKERARHGGGRWWGTLEAHSSPIEGSLALPLPNMVDPMQTRHTPREAGGCGSEKDTPRLPQVNESRHRRHPSSLSPWPRLQGGASWVSVHDGDGSRDQTHVMVYQR